jgi:hypothetical protein
VGYLASFEISVAFTKIPLTPSITQVLLLSCHTLIFELIFGLMSNNKATQTCAGQKKNLLNIDDFAK